MVNVAVTKGGSVSLRCASATLNSCGCNLVNIGGCQVVR